MEMCRVCKERPVHIKKSGLCSRCYQRSRVGPRPLGPTHNRIGAAAPPMTRNEVNYAREYLQPGWVFHPATFWLADVRERYTPDFWDPAHGTFIEVMTMQRYRQGGARKVGKFRFNYPGIRLLVATPDNQTIPPE